MKKRETWVQAARLALCALLFAAALGLVWELRGLTAEELSALAPRNVWLAALWLLALYLLKSLSVFFPLLVLQAGAGLLFPLPLAVALNLLGVALGCCLGYGLGRLSGRAAAERVLDRYPKASAVTRLYEGREVLASYVFRVVGLIPMDVFSMLMGAMGARFPRFLLGSLLGLLPGLVCATVLGSVVSNPSLPVLVGVGLAYLLLAGVSALVYLLAVRRRDGNS